MIIPRCAKILTKNKRKCKNKAKNGHKLCGTHFKIKNKKNKKNNKKGGSNGCGTSIYKITFNYDNKYYQEDGVYVCYYKSNINFNEINIDDIKQDIIDKYNDIDSIRNIHITQVSDKEMINCLECSINNENVNNNDNNDNNNNDTPW